MDSGRGMKKNNIADIGAYVQFNRDFYEQQGTGLGLAIIKTICKLYSIDFSIESIENKYTKVSLSFDIIEL